MADDTVAPARNAATSNGNGDVSQHRASLSKPTSSFSGAASSTTATMSNSNHHHHHPGASSSSASSSAAVVGYLSTTALEQRLRKLRDESAAQSQLLTQKLAESQSGQNLLHMSTRLSALPPLLHSLLQQLHPALSSVERAETTTVDQLQRVRQQVLAIRLEERRASQAVECADLYRDVASAERILRLHTATIMQQQLPGRRAVGASGESSDGTDRDDSHNDVGDEESDPCSDLERVAHLCQYLTRQVEEATAAVSLASSSGSGSGSATTASSAAALAGATAAADPLSALPTDTERAGFVLRLAPRVRRIEADLVRLLSAHAESVLRDLSKAAGTESSSSAAADEEEGGAPAPAAPTPAATELLLLKFGALARAFLVVGRGRDVERLFATVAVFPSLNLSMGRLDEGGARGECAGLASYLDQVVNELAIRWGRLLRYSLLLDPQCWGFDLVTCGVWVPIVTTLTADAGIQMAIFSPGIASILQANYVALDQFVSRLAQRLLVPSSAGAARIDQPTPWEKMYHQPPLAPDRATEAQARIFSHPKTLEFSKKWNLPIYYQLRFGECCARLNKAIDGTMRDGWIAQVFTGNADIRSQSKLELPLFLELYDVLHFLWKPNVLLKPLTNRFLRGATQLVGRVVSFCKSGLEGTIRFGENGDSTAVIAASSQASGAEQLAGSQHGASLVENGTSMAPPPQPSSLRPSWSWSDSEQDVAAVAWELNILESAIRTDYAETICAALGVGDESDPNQSELRVLVLEVLQNAVGQIPPLVDAAWNDCIVKLLTTKCSAPLSAVKGVAATYRMTNRPPPSQASPFVATVLRPLKEFNSEIGQRVPSRVGTRWRHQIVVTVSDRYTAAVEELLTTVQRTEVALSSRRARRVTTAGMSDGDKVKLQVYLDYQRFAQSVVEVGVEPSTVIGLSRLQSLTAEGEAFARKGSENGN